MNDRRSAGPAGPRLRVRASGAVALALAAALIATLWAVAGGGVAARPGPRPLDHHAVVLNGAIMGSAFAIAPDLALTNAHVVAGLNPGAEVRLRVAGVGSGRARLVAVSRRMDLALLRLPRGLLPAVAASDAAGRAGLRVLGAGVDASGGPDAGARLELPGAVTDPRTDLAAYGPGLVVAMPGVRPGFSGGPVLDGQGRLVGMIAAIRDAPAASGYAPLRRGAATEAFVLRGPEIRREAMRLLAAAGG